MTTFIAVMYQYKFTEWTRNDSRFFFKNARVRGSTHSGPLSSTAGIVGGSAATTSGTSRTSAGSRARCGGTRRWRVTPGPSRTKALSAATRRTSTSTGRAATGLNTTRIVNYTTNGTNRPENKVNKMIKNYMRKTHGTRHVIYSSHIFNNHNIWIQNKIICQYISLFLIINNLLYLDPLELWEKLPSFQNKEFMKLTYAKQFDKVCDTVKLNSCSLLKIHLSSKTQYFCFIIIILQHISFS